MTPVIKLDGLGHDCPITLNTALAETDIGKVVSLHATTAKTAILGADNAEAMGVLMAVDEVNNTCTVELRGWHLVSYSGGAPSQGIQTLLVDGTGKVKSGAGRKYLIGEVIAATTQLWLYLG